MSISLQQLGFESFFENQFSISKGNPFVPARVISEHKEMYRLQSEKGEFLGEVSGKLLYTAVNREDFPVVGDWVYIQELEGENKAIIHSIFDRKTKLSRKAPGKNIEEQVLCANMDIIFIVQPMDFTFNPNRIERYLTIVWESGAIPVVVLTKKDLSDSPESIFLEAKSVALGVKVHSVNSLLGDGLEEIEPYLQFGKTIVFIGQSGAGKSTLINKLSKQDLQKTQDTRKGDARGKHTTTHRELFVLDGGALLIDTPGLREIQLWGNDSMLEETYYDIKELASRCKFSDCNHESESGCAVLAAIENGYLSEERFANYSKMKRELLFLESKMDETAKLQRKQKDRQLHKNIRERLKQKYGNR
ncbi:MAG: ribosome small subunit-dependent GTPase A [Leptospiraceae bacterium]|nr:ribosome small subunit-dependent GTPase A [Leptospiraceae bacterium]